MSLIIVKPTKPTNAQDADIREPKVGDVLKYYHPRTGKYVGKVKVVNIHRHSDAKWDAQYECEYLDGELKGGRFRDEGGVNISFDSAAEFKVGDKVKHTQYGTIGKVFEIDPAGNVGVQWNNGQAYYGKTAKPLSLIIAADSAAMDAAPDKAKRKEMEKEIRNITDSISRGFFYDEQFLATRMVADALRKVGYRVEVTGGNYINNGKSKEYKIRAEKEGEVFNGAIYLMAAGTIDDPFKRYDVSVMW